MFYEEVKPDEALRLGDIVTGFVLGATLIDSPSASVVKKEYSIRVSRPDFAVILSPCCSIGNKTIALVPLLPVLPDFFRNPYISEDLTRVNRPMTGRQAVPPDIWKKLSPDERQRRVDLTSPEAYGYVEYFVYGPHQLLPTYTLKVKSEKKEAGYYMVDFRNATRVRCNQISSPKSAPIETKRLQLSIPSRSDLRDKLAFYYGRPAEEDQILVL